jgi:hypothetical protein
LTVSQSGTRDPVEIGHVAAYDENLTLAQARERYFAENGFSARYDDRWIKVNVGPRKLPVLPNTAPRVAAVRIHDLHHVVAEYDTSWRGEGEISAFELASGCGPYLAAWVLNLGGLSIGFWFSPRRVWQAFVRGRNARNLYREGFDERRLQRTVGELRRELGLDLPPPRATVSDAAWFGLWVTLSVLYALGGVLSVAALAAGLYTPVKEDHGTAQLTG